MSEHSKPSNVRTLSTEASGKSAGDRQARWKAQPGEVDYQLKRTRLLASASELIASTGIEGLRLDSVARHAGVARSSLYRYFDSKDQLVYELLLYEMTRLQARFASRTDKISDPAERLLAIVLHAVDASRNDSVLQKLIGSGSERTLPTVRFALEHIPAFLGPQYEAFGFFAGLDTTLAQERYLQLARWVMHIIFSLGVFGRAGLSASEEAAMIRAMLLPVLREHDQAGG